MIKVSAIPVNLLDVVWPKCEEYLQRVVNVSHGELSLDYIKKRLIEGESLLMTVSDDTEIIACCTIEVRVLEDGVRAMYVPIIGGESMEEWGELLYDTIANVAREHDCTELRGLAARKGWLRILKKRGWEEIHTAIKLKI